MIITYQEIIDSYRKVINEKVPHDVDIIVKFNNGITLHKTVPWDVIQMGKAAMNSPLLNENYEIMMYVNRDEFKKYGKD